MENSNIESDTGRFTVITSLVFWGAESNIALCQTEFKSIFAAPVIRRVIGEKLYATNIIHDLTISPNLNLCALIM